MVVCIRLFERGDDGFDGVYDATRNGDIYGQPREGGIDSKSPRRLSTMD